MSILAGHFLHSQYLKAGREVNGQLVFGSQTGGFQVAVDLSLTCSGDFT